MPTVGNLFNWLVVCVIFSFNWCCCPTDGSCLYPGHQSNERIDFSNVGTNNVYPAQTIANYFCDHALIDATFKTATCHENGTWIIAYTWDHVNCSIVKKNRCKRSPISGSSILKTYYYEGACFSLYEGINEDTKKRLQSVCDIDVFMPKLGVFNQLKENMCYTSFFEDRHKTAPTKIFVAMRTEYNEPPKMVSGSTAITVGSKIVERAPPNCSYLQCSSDKSEAIVTDVCRRNETYWICKYNISSCGHPSQEMYSIMTTTGIYVNNTASYTCQSGYETTGYLIRRCEKDGLWSGNPPKCSTAKETNTGQVPSAEGDENASTPFGFKTGEEDLLKIIVGSVSGVTLFLIALMWLVLAVLLWRDQRKQVK